MGTSKRASERPILGYFMFTDLGDGCLGSKYSNTINNRIFGETAMLVLPPVNAAPNSFIGDYFTSWLDLEAIPDSGSQARLKIDLKPGSLGGQFTLRWDNPHTNTPYYYGEGFICNGLLVGAYWDEGIRIHLR